VLLLLLPLSYKILLLITATATVNVPAATLHQLLKKALYSVRAVMERSPLSAHTFAYTSMYLYIEQFMPIVQQLVQNFWFDIVVMFLLR
jgi:hypothetical protein